VGDEGMLGCDVCPIESGSRGLWVLGCSALELAIASLGVATQVLADELVRVMRAGARRRGR
jgi:hypothetical protein